MGFSGAQQLPGFGPTLLQVSTTSFGTQIDHRYIKKGPFLNSSAQEMRRMGDKVDYKSPFTLSLLWGCLKVCLAPTISYSNLRAA